jgi:hypothetical protein
MEPLKIGGTSSGKDHVGGKAEVDDEEDGAEYREMFPDPAPTVAGPAAQFRGPAVIIGEDVLKAFEALVQARVDAKIEEFKRVLDS